MQLITKRIKTAVHNNKKYEKFQESKEQRSSHQTSAIQPEEKTQNI